MKVEHIMMYADSMSIEELKTLEQKLHKIRCRKERAVSLCEQLNELISEAKTEGFTFSDIESGQVITGKEYIVYDEQK